MPSEYYWRTRNADTNHQGPNYVGPSSSYMLAYVGLFANAEFFDFGRHVAAAFSDGLAAETTSRGSGPGRLATAGNGRLEILVTSSTAQGGIKCYLPTYLSIDLSVYLPTYLSIYPSIYRSIHRSSYLPVETNWSWNQLNLKSVESQSNWVSKQLTFKSIESEINWNSIQLNFKSVDSHIYWISHFTPIGFLSLETSATASCGRYVISTLPLSPCYTCVKSRRVLLI